MVYPSLSTGKKSCLSKTSALKFSKSQGRILVDGDLTRIHSSRLMILLVAPVGGSKSPLPLSGHRGNWGNKRYGLGNMFACTYYIRHRYGGETPWALFTYSGPGINAKLTGFGVLHFLESVASCSSGKLCGPMRQKTVLGSAPRWRFRGVCGKQPEEAMRRQSTWATPEERRNLKPPTALF